MAPITATTANARVIVRNKPALCDAHCVGWVGHNTRRVLTALAAEGKQNRTWLPDDAHAAHRRPLEILIQHQVVTILAGRLTRTAADTGVHIIEKSLSRTHSCLFWILFLANTLLNEKKRRLR